MVRTERHYIESVLDIKPLDTRVLECVGTSRSYTQIGSITSCRENETRPRDDSSSRDAGKHQAVPITVRQLEALVRVAEALAKLRLRPEVLATDVHEALRLFKVSTMAAANTSSKGAGAELRFLNEDLRTEIQNAETFLKQRLPTGADVNTLRVVEEAIGLGHSDTAIRRAIAIMTDRNELSQLLKGRRLRRNR